MGEWGLKGEVVRGENGERVGMGKNVIGMGKKVKEVRKVWDERGLEERDVYVVELLRRLKGMVGEYGEGSYKGKGRSMGRKEDRR